MTVPECFVCSEYPIKKINETPFVWIEPRIACEEHIWQARLVDDRPLEEFLSTYTNNRQVEDSGINILLNPIYINGIKCWLDFVAGSRGIIEEVFKSDSHLEYFIQHTPAYLNQLYKIYVKANELERDLSFLHFANTMKKEMNWDMFNSWINKWNSNNRLIEVINKIGIQNIQTANDAEVLLYETTKEMISNRNASDYFESYPNFIRFIVVLAKTRFAHFNTAA